MVHFDQHGALWKLVLYLKQTFFVFLRISLFLRDSLLVCFYFCVSVNLSACVHNEEMEYCVFLFLFFVFFCVFCAGLLVCTMRKWRIVLIYSSNMAHFESCPFSTKLGDEMFQTIFLPFNAFVIKHRNNYETALVNV